MLSINEDLYQIMILNILHVFLYVLAYYFLRYVQIPFLYDKAKKWQFVLSIILSSIILFGLWRFGLKLLDGVRGIESESHYIPLADYLVKVIRFYSPAMALLAIEFHFEGKKEKQRVRQLEKEKLSNELKFLKAQINPHFLFNTLNNLYSSILSDSPSAPDMILRLSSILDYVLYKSQNNTVSITEEINTIENFIILEKIRYGERLEIDFQKNIKHNGPISPLLLLSLIENAFKYGTSGDIDEPKISIEINEERERLTCQVWNMKSKYSGKLFDQDKKENGLEKLKRQLQLVYPKKHELVIEENETSFEVTLIINKI